MNKVMLIGRLTKTPELRATQTGKQVCDFTIATNRINGKECDFIDCIVWDKQAENLCKYQTKGSLIGIEGQLRIDTYKDKDNNSRKKTYVMVGNIEYLQTKEKTEENPYKDMNTKVESDIGQSITIEDSDLPF